MRVLQPEPPPVPFGRAVGLCKTVNTDCSKRVWVDGHHLHAVYDRDVIEFTPIAKTLVQSRGSIRVL